MTDLDSWLSVWLSRIEDNIEVRPLPSAKSLFSRDPDTIKQFITGCNGQDIYFGVYGREGQKGDKEHVKKAHCVFVDIDFKDLEGGEEQAKEILTKFTHQPSMVVASGGGYHCYWFLINPVPADAEVEAVLNGMAIELKADTQAAETARILRVPGTYNRKYKPVRSVKIIEDHPENSYLLFDFKKWAKPKGSVLTTGSVIETTGMFSEGQRDKNLFHTANCLTKGGMPEEEQFDVLTLLVNSWGEHDPKWVATKVRSAMARHGKKERNLSEEIREWLISLGSGSFSVTECDKELNIVTKQDRVVRRVVFHRLCGVKDPLIKRDKNSVNRYIVLNKDEEIWTLDNIDMSCISVKLPLNIQKKTKLFHGAIVTVGGVTGTGKTMFALNFIRDNMHDFEMFYLNSEMSKQELNAKQDAFLHTAKSSWNFTIVNVMGDMASSVRKDKINIIDYLQAPSEKPFLIRDSLDAIKSKLGTGMALVLIQRKSGNPWGEGGQYSAHNASLYINLDWSTCEIMKNRFREADEFRGKDKRSFDIVAGNIEGKGGWYPATEKEPPEKKYKGLVHERTDPDFTHED